MNFTFFRKLYEFNSDCIVFHVETFITINNAAVIALADDLQMFISCQIIR
jgi:hypothetical protein